jgi:branched-chain amino acid transport system permease protein
MTLRPIAVCAAILLAVAWPAVGGNDFMTSVGSMALGFLVLSQALNLIYGYAGFFCMAIPVFWAVGGYGAARLAVSAQLPPLLAIGVGGLIAAGVGLVLGVLTLDRGRSAFAILSMVLLLFAQILVLNWSSITGGGQGIPALPEVTVAGYRLETTNQLYYLTLAVSVLCVGVLYALVSSAWGRTLRATNQDEVLSASFGINLLKERTLALTVAALVSGLVGGVQVFRLTIADPSILSLTLLAPLFAIVFIGGPGRFGGVLVASIVITFLPELARDFGGMRNLVYGGLLLVFCLLFPSGIPRPRLPWHRRAGAGSGETEHVRAPQQLGGQVGNG